MQSTKIYKPLKDLKTRQSKKQIDNNNNCLYKHSFIYDKQKKVSHTYLYVLVGWYRYTVYIGRFRINLQNLASIYI